MANVASIPLVERPDDKRADDQAAGRLADVECTAELAECTCPDYCERDHDTD